MKSNSESYLGNSNRFKSIPDGRRVFLVRYPWTGYYVIPDSSTECQLARKISREYLFLVLSLIVIAGGVWFFRDAIGRYAAVLIPLLFFPLAALIRWMLYRNELHGLQKIDYSSAVSSSYSEFQKRLRSHSNNLLPNYEISLLVDIPDSPEKIVILKYTEPFSNVLRCRLDGSIVWQAELPAGSNDVYTNIEWKDQKFHAFSRSCRSVLLDENTGRILSAEPVSKEKSA
jgi:hypothetical protein